MRVMPIVAAALVAACASEPPAAQLAPAGPEPTLGQADQAIRTYLSRSLKDPDSLKQLAITRGPYLKTYRALPGAPWRSGWVVCFEYNAKNAYGGYVGVRPAAVAMQGLDSGAVVLDALPDFGLSLYC